MKRFFISSLALICLWSCQDDLDDVFQPESTVNINNFVWNAMNIFYLYKSDSPNLSNTAFESNEAYANFLSSYESPELLFKDLLADQDRFSVIVSDYTALENSLDGLNFTTGMQYVLVRVNSSSNVFGFARYVLPNSPAALAGIERGTIFNRVNGSNLSTNSNFSELLGGNSFSIGLAEFDGANLTELPEEISLEKVQLQENPIHKTEVVTIDGTKVGYLMYNNFRSNFDQELNNVFGTFRAEGIDELVLDFRYNSGGSVDNAKDLAEMITGQFSDEIFAFQFYNNNFTDGELLFDERISDGSSVNSLNLNQVYVLTGTSTASASELIINSLSPYINVIQIGETTVGKFEGSTTLYDSDDFGRQGANINHRYALQPLIVKYANANGITDYFEGLVPDIAQSEDYVTPGELGNVNEPLFNRALLEMGLQEGEGKPQQSPFQSSEVIFNSQSFSPSYQRMYVK